MSAPFCVSVVIPARNSAATLERTIRSLLDQTHPHWEAIVIENGSTDDTLEVARDWAARDSRIRCLRSEPGICLARNAGIAEARSEWLLFLDADDWILPLHLESLTGVVVSNPTTDAVHCGWQRVAEDGTVLMEVVGPDREDLFWDLSQSCVFAIHSCLVRKSLVKAVGGFDPELQTCEDWDLWQRIAKLGAKFRLCREVLACYLMRSDSASSHVVRMATDSRTVILRSQRADLRLSGLALRMTDPGDPSPSECHEATWYCAIWSAGFAIGQGLDPGQVLNVVGEGPAIQLNPEACMSSLFSSVMTARGRPLSDWAECFHEVEAEVTRLMDDVEARLRQPRLSRATRRALEKKICAMSPLSRPYVVGGTWAVEIDLAEPVKDVVVDRMASQVMVRVHHAGEIWGELELPVMVGRVPSGILLDALSVDFGWRLLGEWFRDRVYPDLTVAADDEEGRWKVQRQALVLGRNLPSSADGAGIDWDAAHDVIGWTVMLQEIWGQPMISSNEFYAPGMWFPSATGILGAGRTVTVDVTDKIKAIPASPEPLNLLLTVGGLPVSQLHLTGSIGELTGDAVRAVLVTEAGTDLCRAVVRQTLVGGGFKESWSLRERLLAVIQEHRRRGDSRLQIKWRNRGILPPPRPATPCDGQTEVGFTERLPILMYHGVGDDVGPEQRRYQMGSKVFAGQVEWLAENGFRSVSLDEWRRARALRIPLVGKCVMFTFDDGFRNFRKMAWPVLRDHGFGAMMFVPSGFVGGHSRWDDVLWQSVPLLDWDEITGLQAQGVEFGSHTRSHSLLTGLSPAEVIRELMQDKQELEHRLGVPVDSVAYPYGAVDRYVESLAGACGFVYGLTCAGRAAERRDSLLAMPRLEMDGRQGLEWFKAIISRERDCNSINPQS